MTITKALVNGFIAYNNEEWYVVEDLKGNYTLEYKLNFGALFKNGYRLAIYGVKSIQQCGNLNNPIITD